MNDKQTTIKCLYLKLQKLIQRLQIWNMSINNQQAPAQDIKSQLRNFINLLQTSDPATYKSLKSSGRLSVILSASEPQSSSVDKENSSQSANRSIKNSQFQTIQNSLISTTIKQLQATGLSKLQQKLLAQLAFCIDDLIKKKQFQQSRLLIIQDQLNKEKKGTDQLLQALVKMDEQQKDLWNTYYQLSDKFKQKSIDFDTIFKQNTVFKEQIQGYKKQLKFVKNLVYIANENYQELQEKYNKLYSKTHLESRNTSKPVLVLRQKRSQRNLLTQRSDLSKRSCKNICSPLEENKKYKAISPDHYNISSSCSPLRKSSRSIKSKKSISPLQKDKQNIECNFKDVYRKMLIKNLKSKKKSLLA